MDSNTKNVLKAKTASVLSYVFAIAAASGFYTMAKNGVGMEHLAMIPVVGGSLSCRRYANEKIAYMANVQNKTQKNTI
jgi:hypothetical protein